MMCGICGIVSFNNSNAEQNVIEKMVDSLRHRGPDDNGTSIIRASGATVFLGQTRLSIIDLSPAGRQPFASSCGRYQIVFNGEIYNYRSIKKELLEKGYAFKSESDTEVILYSYIEWGEKSLSKFIGMFAFCIVDLVKNTVFLARDRAGVKPLYIHKSNENILFASEIKAFHKHPEFRKAIDTKAFSQYMRFGYIPAPRTIFVNTKKVMPGSFLKIDLNSGLIDEKIYWSASDHFLKPQMDISFKEASDYLENLFIDAFNLRMVSDVPVGVFLSGGYDSTLVSAILQSHSGSQINTFTIGFNEKQYDESPFASAVAKQLGTKHHEKICSLEDFREILPLLPEIYDEPFADSSSIPTILLSRFAKQKVTVALSADGGDEVFGGYSKYFAMRKLEKIRNHPLAENILKSAMTLPEDFFVALNGFLPQSKRQRNIRDKIQKFKRAVFSDSSQEMFLNASKYVSETELAKFLKEDVFSLEDTNFLSAKSVSESFSKQMQLIDFTTFMADDVLVKVDRATMSTQLEGREPLIDHRIVEFAAQLPESFLFSKTGGKTILKEILYKYVPKKLVDRPKSGFQTPVFEWLKNDIDALIEKHLCKHEIEQDNLFNYEEIDRTVEEYKAGKSINISKIWFVLTFQMWKEKWM